MSRTKLATLLLTGLLGACAKTHGPPPAGYAITDVNVLPMDRDEVLAHQTVVVRDGRIADMGPTEQVAVPPNVTRIAGGGAFLIPGLTDAHVHLLSPIELPLYVANGVTTVFNLNGRPAHLLWRAQVEQGKRLGPRIFSTGPLFAVARTPEEDVRLVDEQARAGYDGIKVYVQVSREEYPALIAEAKRQHLLLMGHIAPGPGFEATLAAGQSIAHVEEFTYTFFNPWHDDDDTHVVYDESRIPLAAQLTAKAGVSVIATISMYRDIVRQTGDIDEYLKTPELKYLAPWTLAGLQPAVNRYTTRNSPSRLKQLKVSLEFQRKLVRALADAGVPIMSGTDATEIGPVAGFSLHDELAELVKCGLTPYQALRAATLTPAQYFGRSQEVGTIQVGRRADLVLLSANPLLDITNTRRIAGVMLRGRWFDAAALKELKEGVAPAYQAELRSAVSLLKSNVMQADTYLEENDPLNMLGSAVLAEVVVAEGPMSLHKLLRAVRQSTPASKLASEDTVNNLGYQLLGQHRWEAGLAVLAMNVEDFSRSSNALDSLADGYAITGQVTNAVRGYHDALALDPNYPNAAFARKFIEQHASAAK